MKYDPIKNPNYVATVVRVTESDLYEVPGLDNLRGYSKFGMQALVSKDTTPGLCILFSTEVQLSEEYAKQNNLFREATLNADQSQTGYLEPNRRVKAIKLRGNRSESLLMPLKSLSYLGPKGIFKDGDVFDSIDGHEICRKYVVKEAKPNNSNQPKARIRRVDAKVFPEHIDSENYFRNEHKIPFDAHVVVTQKLHGTSVRYGNVPAIVDEQAWWERLLRRPRKTTHRFVVGSRRTVKSVDLSAEGQNKNHYYADGDLWTKYADEHKLADRIPKDHIIYGELVGFTPDGAEIQKNYTYDCEPKQAKLYVYRVAVVTTDGHVVDYSDSQMRQWCGERGFDVVPRLWVGIHCQVEAQWWLEKRYYDNWAILSDAQRPIQLSHPKLVDEGICIRYDGPHGIYILKAKSPSFLEHESKVLDTGDVDLEAVA